MESRFDMTNFEQSLREQADQFTMMPSKKVWNGIYNSLHPGSIWPSISMLLFFLLALLGIGPLNNPSNGLKTNSGDNFRGDLAGNLEMTAENTQKTEEVFNIKNYLFSNKVPLNNVSGPAKLASLQTHLKLKEFSATDQGDNGTNIMDISLQKSADDQSVGNMSLEKVQFLRSSVKGTEIISAKEAIGYSEALEAEDITQRTMAAVEKGLEDNLGGYNLDLPASYDSLFTSIINSGSKTLVLIHPEVAGKSQEDVRSGSDPVKASGVLKKRKAKVTWVFYATPTISSVYFNGKAIKDKNPQNNNISPIIINPNQVENQMRYNARAGLNIGTEMNYSLAQGWNLVGGLQLSYTGYNILSHKVHPSFAELVLREGDYGTLTKRYITYYGSGEGQDEITLHNTSVQLSLPVGASHSVWKNNNVEISISATVEPLLVLHANAYMLSADGRNYVNDPELMRQSNISGQVGSRISFSGEKVKWHIGPVIRYQVLSTFKNIYPVNEHLIDYGIRIGISR